MDGAVDSSLVLTSEGTKADALIINASNTAGGIDMDAGTSGIDIDTTGPLSIDSAKGPSNITHTSAGATGALVTTQDALKDSITTNPTDATNNANLTGLTTTTSGNGSGAVLKVVITGNKVTGVTVTTAGTNYAAGDTLTVAKSQIAGSGANGKSTNDLVFTLVADDISTNGGDLTIAMDGSVDSSLVLSSKGTKADALIINASDTAGGIDMDAGTGGIAIDTTGVLSIDSAGAASNISHTATANGDFTISMDGEVDASLILSSSGTAADALQITTSAGGMDITNGGAAGEDLDISSTNASLNLTAGESAANAIVLNASHVDGGIDIDAGTAGIAIDTSGKLSIDSAGAASNISHSAGALVTTADALVGSMTNISAAGGQTITSLATTTNGKWYWCSLNCCNKSICIEKCY